MPAPEEFWLRRARGLVRRHRLARWLELALPALLVASAAGAFALLLARHYSLPLERIWLGVAAALVAAAAAPLFSRTPRLSLAQAFVRLEEHGHLHNRLTSARAGIGAWPAPVLVPDEVRWDWRRLLLAPALAAAFLLAGGWAPLPVSASAGPREEPMAWSQVQSWLDSLQEARLVEPEALEKIEARLNELRQQAPEKWYEQSSLEAGDSLREQTSNALKKLQRDLDEAERVGAADQSGAAMRKDELKQLGDAWNQALSSLAGGDLPMNKELLDQAKNLQPGQRQLSPEQMQALRQRMQDGLKVCEKCVGPSKQPGDQRGPASGGEGGGGETAPLSFKKDPTDLHGKEKEKLENDDLSRALPAETLAVTTGEHEVKKDAPLRAAGGEIAGPGAGGGAVWRETMVPRDREALQRFFK